MRTACDDIAEMKALCRELARDTPPGERMKVIYSHIAKAADVSWESARKYWGGKKKVVPGYVLHNLKDAVEAHERETRARFLAREADEARNHFLTHHSMDTEFYRQRVAETFQPSLRGVEFRLDYGDEGGPEEGR